MTHYTIIGAGLQGEAIAYDILKFDNNSKITLADKDMARFKSVKSWFDKERVEIKFIDANDKENIFELMEKSDVAIGAASYELNDMLTDVAIKTHTHFCDLGGNNTIVEKQFERDIDAKAAGVKIIPDCGIAPGAVSIIASQGINSINNPEYVYIKVGGLPQHPQGNLKYMKVFSIKGLVNEYIEPVEILEDYHRKIIPSLGGIETLVVRNANLPNGQVELEAAYTSGGSSTLTKTYEGKIKTLNYKTLRYPGHWEIIIDMNNRGLFKDDKRIITEAFLEREISYDDEDLMFVNVIVGNKKMRIEYDMVDFYDKMTGHSAMQRTTGYSAAIIAQMMAHNEIKETGILNLEKVINPYIFFSEWKKRKLNLNIKISGDR